MYLNLMMDVFHFRVATLKDIPQIVRLVESVYRGEASKRSWTTEADILDGQRTDATMLTEHIQGPDKVILVCEKDHRIVGSVCLQKKEDCGFLSMLSIDLSFQDQKLGRKLIEQAEHFVVEQWRKLCMKMTVIHLRDELIAWYQRRGYQKTGRVEAFPSDPRYGISKVPLIQLIELKKDFANF